VQRIYVINRSPERVEALKKQFGARVRQAGWDETTGLLGGAGLLVNTTPLGMTGQPPLEINLRCPASLVVAELVYDPLVTPLMLAAREKGLRNVDGLGMLLHQAVRGFELWFGVKPEVTPELRALVEADLIEHKDEPEKPAPPTPAELAVEKALKRKKRKHQAK
jgi:shikimate dehydrogenase